MSKYTELASEILTSEWGKRIYEDVAEVYGESFTSLWMMQVIGIQLDRFGRFSEEFIYQVTPETATWTIEFWEREYGIISNPLLSLEQRRAQVSNKMIKRAAITPYRIEQTVEKIYGVECVVTENFNGVGHSVNAFRVSVKKYIDNETIEGVRSLVTKLKPSHLVFDVTIAQLMEASGNIYAGVGVSSSERYSLRVVQ